MDEDQIYIQVQKCKHLKYKFRGVYAADNYPLNLPVNSFIIVNPSRADSFGTHWVMLAKGYAYPVLYFADPLALPLTAYKDIFARLQQCTDLHMMMDVMEQRRDIQSPCHQQTHNCVVYFVSILRTIFIAVNFLLYQM